MFHCYSKIWQVLEGDLGRLTLVLVVCLYRESVLVYSAQRGSRVVRLYLARTVVIVQFCRVYLIQIKLVAITTPFTLFSF